MLASFLLGFALQIALLAADDVSCNSKCFTDKPPTCGTWLLKEANSAVAGTYQLGVGVLNMSCTFSSLPVPASVAWVHKAPHATGWKEIACSTKEENKVCTDSEHRVDSRCVLRTTELTMTGSYRCQAATPNDGVAQKSYGSEIDVNVVGVAKAEVTDSSLRYGELGHINVEVCAHPKPDVFWLTPDAILRSPEGNGRFASTHLHHKKVRSSPEAPAANIPYCYTSQLLIRSVDANDTFVLLVKTEGTEKRIPLALRVTGVPIPKGAESFGISGLFAAIVAKQLLL